jgi:hypothetical protein
MIPTTTAGAIWNGVIDGLAGVGASLPVLKSAAEALRALVLRVAPDGLAGDLLVMSAVAIGIPRAVVFEGHCAAHALMLAYGAGISHLSSYDNPVYASHL